MYYSIRPRTAWKSSSPLRLRNCGRQLWPHSLFSFRRRHRVVMNDRNSAKLNQRILSPEACATATGLVAAIAFLYPRPVGGEMFLLTAPFIERPSGLQNPGLKGLDFGAASRLIPVSSDKGIPLLTSGATPCWWQSQAAETLQPNTA